DHAGMGARLSLGYRPAGPPGDPARGRGGRRVTHPPTPPPTPAPFFAGGCARPAGPDVAGGAPPGARRIGGRVLDGAGDPVPDALVETWQADPAGRFAHPDDPRGPATSGFRGFGRCPTDAQGRWAVQTLKPGPL